MTRRQLLKRITPDPDACGGKACVRGTRVFVDVILDSLADGMPPEEVMDHYPQLAAEDVRAAVAYASAVTA